MNEPMNNRRPENRELARRLEAYADARLSPDPAAMAHVRSELLARAAEQAAPAVPATAPVIPIDQYRARPWRPRRLAISLLAASLMLALMAGAVAAAPPGGALYPVKLWVETATLPADPAARAAAELARLETRLAEASAAAAAGNGLGVEAALDAYGTSLEAVMAATADHAPPDLESVLTHHLTVLEGLLNEVPEPARNALQQVLQRGSQAVDRVPPIGPPGDVAPPVPGDVAPPVPGDVVPPVPGDVGPPVPGDVGPPLPGDVFPPVPGDGPAVPPVPDAVPPGGSQGPSNAEVPNSRPYRPPAPRGP